MFAYCACGFEWSLWMPKYPSKSWNADTICSISKAIQSPKRLLLMFPCTFISEILISNKKVIFYLSWLSFCHVFYICKKTHANRQNDETKKISHLYWKVQLLDKTWDKYRNVLQIHKIKKRCKLCRIRQKWFQNKKHWNVHHTPRLLDFSLLKSAVNQTCQIKSVYSQEKEGWIFFPAQEINAEWVGRWTVHPHSVLHSQGGRWLHYCCCCSALGLCCLPLMQRRIITIDLTNHSRKEWIWPWRGSTLMLESNTILSSSEVSCSQTFR